MHRGPQAEVFHSASNTPAAEPKDDAQDDQAPAAETKAATKRFPFVRGFARNVNRWVLGPFVSGVAFGVGVLFASTFARAFSRQIGWPSRQ